MPESTPTAVIGCGRWGINLVRVLARLGSLKAVADRDPEALARAGAVAGDITLARDPEAVFDDPAIRAVMIATPADTHGSLATLAIGAGKDVFVEKPLAMRLEEARDLVALAREANRVLMVGHLLEYHPAVLKLYELVRGGELGEIRYMISNRLNLGRIRTEENALWSFAPHDIAVILRLAGAMPFEVCATGGCYVQAGIADITVTQLRFLNGTRAHIFVSWLHPFKEQKLVVIGAKKMATFDDVHKKLTLIDLRISWEVGHPVPITTPEVDVPFSLDEPLERECLHFLQCVETRSAPYTDGANGLDVLRVLDAAGASLAANGRPVRVTGERGPGAGPTEGEVAPVITTAPQPAVPGRVTVESDVDFPARGTRGQD